MTISAHSIIRYDQDGKNPTVLYNNSKTVIYAVALDHYEQNVFWIEANQWPLMTIRYTKVNGYGREILTFVAEDNQKLKLDGKHLAVDQSYVYVVINSHIMRISRTEKSYDMTFDVSQSEVRLNSELAKFFCSNSQFSDHKHPCLNNYGNCGTDICVAVPDSQGRLESKCVKQKNWFTGIISYISNDFLRF